MVLVTKQLRARSCDFIPPSHGPSLRNPSQTHLLGLYCLGRVGVGCRCQIAMEGTCQDLQGPAQAQGPEYLSLTSS